MMWHKAHIHRDHGVVGGVVGGKGGGRGGGSGGAEAVGGGNSGGIAGGNAGGVGGGAGKRLESYGVRKWVGLVLVPVVLVGVMLMPGEGFDWRMRVAAGLVGVMAVLWMCESLHLSVTALLPLVVLPVGGVAAAKDVVGSYSHDLIFVFIGGFALANAFEHSGLHRRVAAWVLGRCGRNKAVVVLGMMGMTAFISMWVNNTATAVMMMPVVLAVVRELDETDWRLAGSAVLGVAAAASIGGMGTPYGSTPNLLFAAHIRTVLGREVGFLEWAAVGVPVVVLMTLGAWWVIWKVMKAWKMEEPANGEEELEREMSEGQEVSAQVVRESPVKKYELEQLQRVSYGGRLKREECLVGLVFCGMVLGWVFRVPIEIGGVKVGITAYLPGVSDGTVAIAGALVLVGLPIGLKPIRWALGWEQAGRIPWNTLLLFGGGMAMAEGISQSGLDKYAAALLGSSGGLSGIGVIGMVLFLVIGCAVVSEFASNTAAAALLLPVVGAVAAGTGHDPIALMLPVAFATSLGFVMPVATPPNALALATGKITVAQMAVVGLILNVFGIVLLWGLIVTVGFWAFGIR